MKTKNVIKTMVMIKIRGASNLLHDRNTSFFPRSKCFLNGENSTIKIILGKGKLAQRNKAKNGKEKT